MNRLTLALLLVASPSFACDWNVTEKVDPMTDRRTCTITSPSARVGIGVRDGAVTFVSPSRYRFDYLTLRVDGNPAVTLDKGARSTDAFLPDARIVMGQIRAGTTLRAQFRDIDGTVNTEAAICNLPALIDACSP